ncbi:MAG: two-component system, cell cycle response regulator DivK [Acidobacteriota bacterium]|nr:two-component system, cell cycle response regulator DivK [Acidobacteriota bacterium]
MGVLSVNGEQEAGRRMEDERDSSPVVLVVEDFEDNRFMMRRLLEMSGYRVVEAVNGNQAVERAVSERPDIILMDLSLPQLDGLAATRRIRVQDGMRKVPIVAVSAHDSADFHAEALAAGCNEYVTKPIDFDRLVELLGRLTTR